jgi:hypothetical protein
MSEEIATYGNGDQSQIEIAKKYPRNLTISRDKAVAIAVSSKEMAEKCIYSIPRKDKSGETKWIRGLTTHAARILAQTYGNIRVMQIIKEISYDSVTAQGIAIDLESNYAELVEVRRLIVDHNGNRYNNDMINLVSNAAGAIASRNAILRIIPADIKMAVEQAATNALLGNLSDEQNFLKKKEEVVRMFREKLGIPEEKLCKLMGLPSVAAIKPEHLPDLIGFATIIKEGEFRVEELAADEVSESTIKNIRAKIQNIKSGKNEKLL